MYTYEPSFITDKYGNLQVVAILLHRVLLRDRQWKYESEEFNGETTTDAFL